MTDQSRSNSNSLTGALLSFIMMALGVGLLVGPFFVHVLSGMAWIVSAVVGVGLILLASLMIAFSQYYIKASSNRAFIRTGKGGKKIVLNGGAMVIPQFHEVRFVSLETVKLVVPRVGIDALITGDNLRVDINAEFYIKVQSTEEGVSDAARTLGDKAGNDQAIMDLVGEKLVSAMRTVAARSDLDHLHSQLDQYREEVKTIVEHDLKPNGLELESVAISHLNQTSKEHLDPDNNLFDAQGFKKITEITNQQRVERSKIQTEADRTVKDQEVSRDKALYLLDVSQETAAAERDAQIKMAQAGKEREANEFSAKQRQISETANIEAEQAIELANVEREKSVAVAGQQRQSASEQAEIERTQTVEIRRREQEIAVANAEKERAAAEKDRFEAETLRESANQKLLTVAKTQEAEREKNVRVIGKEAEAATKKIERNMEADVEAYSIEKKAEAEQNAATKNAAAVLTRAEADQQAKVLEAKGTEALAIVPVNVNRAQVDVDKAAVGVTRERLEAQSANEKMAFELEVRKAEIAADRDVRIAQAQALGQGLASADMRIFGDPSTFRSMMGSFNKGQQIGEYVGGVKDTMPPEVVDLAVAGVSKIAQAGSAVLERLTGVSVPPETVEKELQSELAKENPGKGPSTLS